jgi:hypothetical protein
VGSEEHVAHRIPVDHVPQGRRVLVGQDPDAGLAGGRLSGTGGAVPLPAS